MRWLVLKDLRILRRSPLLVALLVVYPIVVAVLIGLALSRGPERPRVAFVNQVPRSSEEIDLGGERVNVAEYGERLFSSIDPVRAATRAEAIQLVRDGDVLGALIVPADITQKLQSGLESARVEVFYNAEDPLKARFVRDTIKSQVQDANAALSRRFTEVAIDYLDLIVSGGRFSFLGQELDVLGLRNAETIVRAAQTRLPPGSAQRRELDRVTEFARLARENLDLTDNVLGSVAQPIRVESRLVDGGASPLSSFAVALALTVSLMFVTLLLAAGLLALEREENAFRRLVRGLVSRTGLLVAKIALAAACSVGVSAILLAGLAAFVGLEASRLPLALGAIAAGALAFAAMGTAIGALTREVRAASLLAFMVALPLAFLALVPSGAVAGGLFDAIRVISALFPFKPALDAVDAALNDAGGLPLPLLHLAALSLAFGALARLGLRRFSAG